MSRHFMKTISIIYKNDDTETKDVSAIDTHHVCGYVVTDDPVKMMKEATDLLAHIIAYNDFENGGIARWKERMKELHEQS